MAEKDRLARRLLHQQNVGILSTHSIDVEGFPFGSVAPFALNYEGEPVMLISDIAQHTRNIKHDKRVSLTIFDRFADDPQASGRLTWIGEAELVGRSDLEVQRRYLRYFPSAESYFEAHDFTLYRIGLRRARFIGGFGQIFWIEASAMLVANPFRESESGIVEHMNRDHTKALFHYAKSLGDLDPSAVSMAGIDGEGFDLLADERILRIDFDAPVETPEEARAALVRLARSQNG